MWSRMVKQSTIGLMPPVHPGITCLLTESKVIRSYTSSVSGLLCFDGRVIVPVELWFYYALHLATDKLSGQPIAFERTLKARFSRQLEIAEMSVYVNKTALRVLIPPEMRAPVPGPVVAAVNNQDSPLNKEPNQTNAPLNEEPNQSDAPLNEEPNQAPSPHASVAIDLMGASAAEHPLFPVRCQVSRSPDQTRIQARPKASVFCDRTVAFVHSSMGHSFSKTKKYVTFEKKL